MGRNSKAAEAEAPATEAAPDRLYRAVALVQDEGGFRIAELAMPKDDILLYCVKMSEPEVFAIQLALAARSLEEAAHNEVDAEGNIFRERCPKCNQPALVIHPTKPVKLCAACSARIELHG